MLTVKDLKELLSSISDDTEVLVGDVDFISVPVGRVFYGRKSTKFYLEGEHQDVCEPPETQVFPLLD